MSKSISNLARSSPLASVRRDQVNVDPLDTSNNPQSGPSTPQQPKFSPKPPVSEPAAFQRLLLPAEILEIEARSFLGLCRRPPLNLEGVSADYAGLISYARSCSWQSVVRLSAKLLFEEETVPEQLLSRITALRFEGLYRMKQYDELATEATGILVEEEKRMATEGEHAKFNYNITVSMRLLLNDIKLVTGRSEEAIEQLNGLKHWLEGCEQSSIVCFWLWQVRSHLVNGYIRVRNWREATMQMNRMLNDLQVCMQGCTSAGDKSQLVKAQILLLTRLARLLFQIGSVKKGTLYFEKASALFAADATVAKDSMIEAQLLMTQGLLLFCAEEFEQALDLFTTIVDTEGAKAESTDSDLNSLSVLPQAAPTAATASVDAAIAAALSVHSQQLRHSTEHSNLAIAVNNLSICCLYVKQIRSAIQRLEQLILQNPARHLTDPVVFNLCTLYDLSYAPDTSATKKKIMQRVASEYHVDDPILHWKSFRLS